MKKNQYFSLSIILILSLVVYIFLPLMTKNSPTQPRISYDNNTKVSQEPVSKEPVTSNSNIPKTIPVIPDSSFPPEEFDVPIQPESDPLNAISNDSININQATLAQLDAVKGIGEVKAQNILSFIQTYGPITNMDQLLAVKGIGSEILSNLKERFYAN